MAQRRMTSLEVINTDAFLDMPQSSQLLYFHLNARADDDGFVSNPKSIMRNCGAQGDDLKLLIAKKFLINFEDGVCVIKHWRINNYIRKDIYTETKYLNHKQILFIRPNGAYTLTDDGRAVRVPKGHFQIENIKPKQLKNGLNKGQNSVHEPYTDSILRIGKDRIGKDITNEPSSLGNKINEIMNLFKSVNPSIGRLYGRKNQRESLERLINNFGDNLPIIINSLQETNLMKYAPLITTPIQLEEKIGTLIAFRKKELSNKPLMIKL